MGQVALTHVTKKFGSITAVDDVSLVAQDGEFLVLLGPSGCGKSTLLRMIAGLEDVTDGVIEIDQKMVNEVEPKDRDLAMVFQSYALYPHLTVRKNIEFPLRTRGVASAERKRLVADAAETLGLGDLLDRKPAQLSGGQRQRVALGRAIVRQPKAFLLDEPLSNLDAKLRVQTRAELVALQKRLDTTMIYVTHDQVEAMTMGERVAILRDGVLQQVAPPSEVYDKPANAFVAGFIGTPPMNLFDALVDGGTANIGEARVSLGELWNAPAGEYVAGIRPEHLSIVAGDVVIDNALRGIVAFVESLGHELHVHVQIDTGATLVVRHSSHLAVPHAGESVGLLVSTNAVHLFDKATGTRFGGHES